MKTWQRILSRSLSVVLSMALLIGICPKFVNALTDETEWFTPSNANGLISTANLTSWWSSALKLSELPNDGGWHFEWSTDGVGVRQGLTKSFPLSGLTLKFDNLENEQEKPSFAIMMIDSLSQQGGNMDPVNPAAGGLALIAVDIADGEIRFENDGIGLNTNGLLRYVNDGTVLLKDEKLKYNNLKGKEFAISFHEAANGAYEVWVDIEGQETLKSSQNLTCQMLESVTYLSNLQNVYVGLSNGRGNTGTTKLDFTSVGYTQSTASDQEPNESGDWFIPKSTYGFIAVSDIASWWGSNMELSNLPNDGGIRWKCQYNGVGIRQGWKQSFALDGLSLKFTGLENPNGKASLLIYLSDSSTSNMDTTVNTCATDYALIALDTEDGELRFENDGATTVDGKTRIREDGTVLLKNDLLKYDSLKGEDFTVTFSRGQSGYNIEVKVGDESVIGTDILTDEMLGRITNLKRLDRVYAGLGSNNGNIGWTTVDLVGIGPFKKTDISRKELTIGNVSGENFWPAMLGFDASPVGGLRYTYTDAFRNVRLGINEKASLNGMYLKLNNITKTASRSPRILLVFSATQDALTKDGMFALILDTDAGTLKLNRSADLVSSAATEDVLISSDALKYYNLAARTVVLRSFADESGGYAVSIRVGNDSPLEGVITSEMMAKCTAFTSYNGAYLTIHPAVMQNAGLNQSFSVDIVEYWSSIVKPEMVISAIDAIGEVSLEHASALRYARNLYDELPSIDKLDVTNVDKLLEAESEFAALAAVANNGLILMSRENAKLTGSSNADVQATIKAWAPIFGLDDLENGGVRFNFKGSSRNVRDGYAGTADLDGLYLQFDRFNADDAEKAKFVLMLGNGSAWGVEYSETRNSFPLTLVLDPSVGTITVMPKNEVVISSDALKLENLAGERFSYEFSVREDDGYDFILRVADKTLTGLISSQAVDAAVSLTTADSCEVIFTSWESNSNYSVDFIGLKQTKLTADEVMALIDSIGLVGIDSGDVINAALAAYEALSDRVKASVENYDTLVSLQNYYLGLDYDTMISDAEELIDEIGKVGYKSGEAIRNAKLAFDRLNSSQQAKVSNASVLKKAISDYEALTSDKIIYESYAYPVNVRFTSTSGMGEWWQYTTFNIVENKALRINFKNAIRDVRNGPTTDKSLDGLILRIANITPDKEGDGTGTKLSLQIGTRDNNYRGGVNLTAFALVLDTYEGAIYGYPGKRFMLQDDALKQANIEGKEILMRVDKTEEDLYRLQVKVAGKTLYTVIPTSLIDNSTIDLKPDSVKIALSPWVNNEDATTDNSTHSFSVDFLSCQSTGKYAFEDLYDLMQQIDLLPKVIGLSDEDTVLGLSDAYRELPRTMRAYVSNYAKLSSSIDQIYDLNAEDVSVWDKEEYNSPETGENSMINISLAVFAVSMIALAGLTLLKRKSKRS